MSILQHISQFHVHNARSDTNLQIGITTAQQNLTNFQRIGETDGCNYRGPEENKFH
jgi:hypothetical protein